MLIETTPESKKRLAVLQLIIGALIVGVVIFLVITLVVPPQQQVNANLATVLRIAWGAVAIGQLAMVVVLSKVGMNAARQSGGDQGDIMRFFFGRTIIAAAMAEGLALFGVVIAWLSAQQYDYALAGVGLVGLILQFPTSNRWESFARRATDPGAM